MKKVIIINPKHTGLEVGQEVTLYEYISEIKRFFPHIQEIELNQVKEYIREVEVVGFIEHVTSKPENPCFMWMSYQDFEEIIG